MTDAETVEHMRAVVERWSSGEITARDGMRQMAMLGLLSLLADHPDPSPIAQMRRGNHPFHGHVEGPQNKA